MAAAAGIQVEDLTKTYGRGRVRALDGVSLAVRPGEVFGLIGPNGAGKTTFFGCLLGLLRPDRGVVRIDGHAADDLAVRRLVGYVPERSSVDRWMTGWELVAYHHALAGRPPETRAAEIAAALERVGLEPAAHRRKLKQYSRGMLQRVAFAQAMLGRPRYLFLDEPASGVDPAGVLLVRRLIKELKAEGATIILNSHQLDQIEKVCDRVAFIRAGKIESIENLAGEDVAARVVAVRWLSGAESATQERLTALASGASARLVELQSGRALFAVADDKGCAALVGALVGAGIAVVEVAPAEGRLERLFMKPATAVGGET